MSTPGFANILVHTPHWLVGGVERVLQTLLPAWAEMGGTVYLATPGVRAPGLPIPAGVRRVEVPANPAARLKAWRRLVADLAVDVVVFNSYEDIAPDIALLREIGVPCVRIHHGEFAATMATLPLGVWFREARALAKANLTVCPSAFDAAALSRFGYDNVCHLPNPVPDEYARGFCPDEKPAANAALYVGRLSPEKNISRLIAAFSEIAAEVPSAELWLTSNPGGHSLREVARMISAAKSPERVVLLPPTSDPREYYRRASFLVLPSFREGFGMAVVEAKKFALPTVMFDLPNNETVRHNHDGLKVPLGDFPRFSDAMADLFRGGELRERLGRSAFAGAGAYNLSEIAERWRDVFAAVQNGAGADALSRALRVESGVDMRKVFDCAGRARNEYRHSFYCYLYRHPAILHVFRRAKYGLIRGGPSWRTFRWLWFKFLVPFISG